MFAKAAAKHPEKYPRFNRFSFLRTDSLNSLDSDNSANVSVPISLSTNSLSSLSSIPCKTHKRSTVSTSRARKDSVSSCSAAQKPAVAIPISPVSVP